MNGNNQAGKLTDTDPDIQKIIDQIVSRATVACQDPLVGTLVKQMLTERREEWLRRVRNQTDHILGYQDNTQHVVGLLKQAGLTDWGLFTCLNSLRDVEGTANLVLDQNPVGLRVNPSDGDHHE
jgi:hypothetical protein